MLATQKQQAPLNIIEILKSRRFPYQTTTYAAIYMYGVKLYYTVSLHQTTTAILRFQNLSLLYYIVSLHQTTTLKTL